MNNNRELSGPVVEMLHPSGHVVEAQIGECLVQIHLQCYLQCDGLGFHTHH